MSGGFYLAMRQGIGMAISLGGMGISLLGIPSLQKGAALLFITLGSLTIVRTVFRTVLQGLQGSQFQDRAIFSKLALPLTLIIRSCPRLKQGLKLKPCSSFVRSIGLTDASFNLHSSELYVLTCNWEGTIFHLVQIALFVGATVLLIPQFGLVEYTWERIVAPLSYGVIHGYLVQQIGLSKDSFLSIGYLPRTLFVHQSGWWAIESVSVVCLPTTRDQLRQHIKVVGRLN